MINSKLNQMNQQVRHINHLYYKNFMSSDNCKDITNTKCFIFSKSSNSDKKHFSQTINRKSSRYLSSTS